MYFHHKFDHEFEGAPPPHRSYLVCALPRSGSSLLCELLANTELAGAPAEYFDHNVMTEFRRIWNAGTLDAYLDALAAKKTSPNGIFGIKTHYHQLIDAFGPSGEPSAHFPNLRLVYIRRRDHVRQAVSFARATQTEQWTSVHHPPAAPPTYDGEQITSLLQWIEREEVAWERWFAERAAPVLRVTYEDFVEAVEDTVTAVMRFLEVNLAAEFQVPKPTLHRQADALNDEWVARYIAEAA